MGTGGETDGVDEVEWHRLFHKAFIDDYSIGSTFRIRYDRNHPERVDAPGDTIVTFGWWLMILATILFSGFAILRLVTGVQNGAL